MNRKILLFLQAFSFLWLLGYEIKAQGITTASMTGVIRDKKNEAVIGATVVAIHEPTGTKYGSVTDENGNYLIPNVKVGEPYNLTVEAVGYKTDKKTGPPACTPKATPTF